MLKPLRIRASDVCRHAQLDQTRLHNRMPLARMTRQPLPVIRQKNRSIRPRRDQPVLLQPRQRPHNGHMTHAQEPRQVHHPRLPRRLRQLCNRLDVILRQLRRMRPPRVLMRRRNVLQRPRLPRLRSRRPRLSRRTLHLQRLPRHSKILRKSRQQRTRLLCAIDPKGRKAVARGERSEPLGSQTERMSPERATDTHV